MDVASCGGAADETGKAPITGDKRGGGALGLFPEMAVESEVCLATFRRLVDTDGNAGFKTEMPRASKTFREACLRTRGGSSVDGVTGTPAAALPEGAGS